VQTPAQVVRQFQPCRPRHGSAGPGQHSPGTIELYVHLGTEVKGEADLVAATFHLVYDVDAAGGPVKENRAPVQCGGIERGVTVVLGRPHGNVTVVYYLDFPRLRMAQPQERTTLG
jgi:hypothetical protein